MIKNYQMTIFDIIGDSKVNEIRLEYQTVKPTESENSV